MTRRVVVLTFILAAVCGIGMLFWRPSTSNMLMATDGTRVQELRIEDAADQIIWKIRSAQGRSAAELGSVAYGAVPSGFQQDVPSSGRPRAFVDGECLTIHIVTERMFIGRGGQARGVASFVTQAEFEGPRQGSSDVP
jgi:hypothetical protein